MNPDQKFVAPESTVRRAVMRLAGSEAHHYEHREFCLFRELFTFPGGAKLYREDVDLWVIRGYHYAGTDVDAACSQFANAAHQLYHPNPDPIKE